MLRLVFVLALSVSCCWCNKFQQSNIPQCQIGDTRCLKDTTNLVLSKYYGGEPRIALASFDPLKIQRMAIKQGGDSPVNIELIFSNVELQGLKDFVCTSVKGFGNDPNGHYEMRLKGPILVLKGPYTINGRILVVPIQGQGMSNFTLENPELIVRWTGKSKQKNGKTHLNTEDLRMTFKISRMQAHFGNLFNGDRALGETTNRFLNENWQDIFNEIKGSIFDAFSLITQSMLNNMWSKHDYKALFKQ